MATYQVELTDGRAFEVEADAPPSESDLLSALGEGSPNVGFDDRTAQGLKESLDSAPRFDIPQVGFAPPPTEMPESAGTELAGGFMDFMRTPPLSAETYTGQPPVGALGGLYEGAAKQVTPENAIILALAGPTLLAKPVMNAMRPAVDPMMTAVQSLIKAYFAKSGAEMVGQESGRMAGDPNMTFGQKVEAGMNTVLGASLAVPGLMPAFARAERPSGITGADINPSFPLANKVAMADAKVMPDLYDLRKREAQASPVVIGEQGAPGMRVPQFEEPKTIVLANQAFGEPKQGGQISFASEANAGAIPNARQVALNPMADALAKAEAERVAREAGAKQGANDDASLPASGKMIGGEGQSSTPKAKGPQIEDANASAPIESPRLYMNPVGPMLKQAGKDVKDLGKAVTGIAKKGVSWYSEPLVERLGTLGGPVSKAVAREAGDIVSKQKKYYGELTTVVDDAKREVGKLNAASTWLRGKVNITDRAATGNMFAQQEGRATVPPGAQAMVGKLDVANRAIGQMGMSIGSGGTASGKFQRMLNSYGVDVVRRGTGPAWEAWVEGVAQANNRPLAETQRFFRRWKDEMDAPGTDVASLNKISQDFVRKYPNTVSHIKVGHAWHEVLVADAFAYLEGAAQRTAAAKAFREKYPVDSGLLAATRKSVQKELQTDKHMKEFDNLIRALQGHPTDALVNTLTAPDTLVGGGARMLGQVVGNPIKSLMLTGNVVTNLAEVVTGGPSIFLGYRNAMKAMARLPDGYAQLELNGAVNRLMMNYAYDPSSPVRSIARMFSNGVRRVTAQAMLNELQEAQAAMSAKVVADSVRNGTLLRGAQEKLIATMRMMGFEERVARDVIRNPNEDVLGQFERRASASLTSGHIAMAERSRAGTSRAFNELFWFHSYPQMTLNQLRAVWKNLATDIEKKNVPQAKANAMLLGKLIGGRTMQGALTTGVYALAFGGMFGLGMQKKKAQEETGMFLVDSLVGGFGGPAAIAKRMIERGGTSKDVVSSIATLSTPVSVSAELYDMGMGNAKYEGLDAFDRVGTFVTSKSPGYKMLKAGMSMWGLAEGNPELDAARKEFYIWRQKTMGSKSMTFTGDEAEDKEFRAQMRKAVKTLEAGGDWKKELAAAGDPDRASKSLYARTVLKTPEGKPLSEEQLGELTERIGLAAVDKMQHYDAMVREVARELGEPAKGEQKQVKDLEPPTGKYAVDQKTPMQRNATVKGGLSKESQQWLDKNGVRLNDAKPETKRGKQVTLMLKDQGKELEAELVKETEGLIKQLSGRASWERKSTQEKQEYFNERMNQLEKRAKFRLRNKAQPK